MCQVNKNKKYKEMAVRAIKSAFNETKDNTSKELNETLTISVCNDLITIDQMIEKKVIIDSDIGRNTNFIIDSKDINKFSVEIISPNGKLFDSNSSEFTENQSNKKYQLSLKSAESGVWFMHFKKHTNEVLSATVSVTSQPLNPNAIKMRVWLRDADSVSQMPPIIFAVIRKGSDAVIGAEVMATINKPNGTQSNVVLNNYNNIYWNYFTDYCGSGRYSVSVLANNNRKNCQLRSVETPKSLSVTFSAIWIFFTHSTAKILGLQSVPQFERQQIVGCFKVTDFMPSAPIISRNIEELLLSETSNERNNTVESPAPKDAKTPIRRPRIPVPNKTDEQLNEIQIAKDNLREKLLVVKKLITYSNLTDDEKNPSKKIIEEIDSFIFSTKSTTMEEVDSNQIKLEELRNRFKNK